jgi:hypothetical protein
MNIEWDVPIRFRYEFWEGATLVKMGWDGYERWIYVYMPFSNLGVYSPKSSKIRDFLVLKPMVLGILYLKKPSYDYRIL